MIRLPDIYLANDLIIYNDLGPRGGHIGKGFRITIPGLEHADVELLEEATDALQVGIAVLGEHDRLQLRWSCHSNYRTELLRYHDETNQWRSHPWAKRQRNELFCRLHDQMERRVLRREELSFFVTTHLEKVNPRKEKGKRSLYEHQLSAAGTHLEQCGDAFSQVVSGLGGVVTPRDDLDHFADFYHYFNPSAADDQRDVVSLFEPRANVLRTCWNSETVPVQPYSGFWRDGYFHGIVVLKQPPRATFAGMMRQLTSLPMINYEIVINLRPLNVRKEIEKEESAHEKLHRTFQHNGRLRMWSAMEKKQLKIQRLMSQVLPYEFLLIVVVRDRDEESLHAKQSAIQTAICGLQGAQAWCPDLPPSSWNHFCAAIPGWTWSGYEDFSAYLEDVSCVDLFPLGSTSEGALDEAEALYQGENGNLVGVRTFTGKDQHASPQHAIMIGKSGSGKSMLCMDLLVQTQGQYGFTVLLDEGLSYQWYAKLCHPDSKEIVIEPNSNVTFNYLDTRGLPLSPMQLADATAMALLLVGHHPDEDRNRLRHAHLLQAIRQLYHDCFREWRTGHPDEIEHIARETFVIRDWQQRLPRGSSFLDAYVAFRDWSEDHRDEADDRLSQVDTAAVERICHTEDDDLGNLSYAYMSGGTMPIHSQLRELLSASTGNSREAEEKRMLGTFLDSWCAHGSYGALLDGPSNVQFDGSLAHFEFGCIPEAAQELRSVAAFLVTNYVRNEIMTRPRGERKRVILEELSSLLLNHGGERITRDFFERMRKYNAWILAIVQQYARLCESPVRHSIMSNIRSCYILKQSDREEVDQLGDALKLPEVTRQTILNFPEPTSLKEPYSSFVYYETRDRYPLIAVGRHVASPEMLYMSASSGGHVEEREATLAAEVDPTTKLLEKVHASNGT